MDSWYSLIHDHIQALTVSMQRLKHHIQGLHTIIPSVNTEIWDACIMTFNCRISQFNHRMVVFHSLWLRFHDGIVWHNRWIMCSNPSMALFEPWMHLTKSNSTKSRHCLIPFTRYSKIFRMCSTLFRPYRMPFRAIHRFSHISQALLDVLRARYFVKWPRWFAI